MTYVKDIDTGELSGLEQMQFFAAGGTNYKGIGHKLGFRVAEVEKGRVVFARRSALPRCRRAP